MSLFIGVVAWVLAFNIIFLFFAWLHGRRARSPLERQRLRKRPDVIRQRKAKALHR